MPEIDELSRPWPDGGPRGGTPVNCAVPRVEPDPEPEENEEEEI